MPKPADRSDKIPLSTMLRRSLGSTVEKHQQRTKKLKRSLIRDGRVYVESLCCVDDAELFALVNEVAQPILNAAVALGAADAKSWKVLVVDAPEVANASAVPSGHLVLLSGLIEDAESDAELACVIAHEAGHLAKSHTLNRESVVDTAGRAWNSVLKGPVGWGGRQVIEIVGTPAISRLHEHDAEQQRERERANHDQRVPHIAKEQECHNRHQDQPEKQGIADRTDTVGNKVRLVVVGHDPDTLGKRLVDFIDSSSESADHLERVRAM